MVRIRQVSISVLLGIAMVPQSSHADEEANLNRDWAAEDDRYTRLQTVTKNVFPSAVGRDRRGRTFRDDVQSNVLTSEQVAKIATLRESFNTQVATGELDQAKETLQAFTTAVETEIANFQHVKAYWMWLSDPPDRTPYLRYLRSNNIDPRNPDEIAALTQLFEQQIDAAQFGEAMGRTYPSLLALLERRAGKDSSRSWNAGATRSVRAPSRKTAVHLSRACCDSAAGTMICIRQSPRGAMKKARSICWRT
jgi:hypothetical protein